MSPIVNTKRYSKYNFSNKFSKNEINKKVKKFNYY